MEKVFKTKEKEVIVAEMEVSLANAIRRTVNEIETLAVKEADVYKNDSSLSDELLVHRVGLIPLENMKLKEGDSIEMKLKVKSSEDDFDVLSDLLGDSVAVKGIPIVRLNNGQSIELVARALLGKGSEHARHLPGVIYYYNLNKILIKPEAKKNPTPAERYPNVFEFDGELKVKDDWAANFDEEDLNISGVQISPTEKMVLNIESWGGMSCSEIVLESVKILNKNLDSVRKILK